MKYALAISFFILISAFPSEQDGTKSPQVKDVININGENKTVPSSTDIDGGIIPPPIPPQPSPEPSPKPTPTTTIPPTSPNTTLSPNPNSTTTIPTPTTSNTTSTTPSPTTPSTPSTTPNGTTPTTKSTTVKPNSTTTSTVTPTLPSTTGAPPSPITVKPEPERRFDGPSFVGGIVLALGLVAIGFVAFKFYKARTELNYHTL